MRSNKWKSVTLGLLLLLLSFGVAPLAKAESLVIDDRTDIKAIIHIELMDAGPVDLTSNEVMPLAACVARIDSDTRKIENTLAENRAVYTSISGYCYDAIEYYGHTFTHLFSKYDKQGI